MVRDKSKFGILIILFFIFANSSIQTMAQQNREHKFIIDSISRLAATINFGENDIVKYNANELLLETLYNVLIAKDVKDYQFDSLKNVSYIEPSDKTFRLITWALKKEDQTFENHGILQTINPKTERTVIFTLKDKSEVVFNPETSIGDAENWYGAVYYKVLPSVINKKNYYTLLGWSGCNQFRQRKVIEVLSFRANGTPMFGSKIFKKYQDKNPVRIVFEYYKQSSMTLIYDTQTYSVSTGKRDPKTKRMISRDITTDMIVFDRLAPLNENMENVKEYYVPEANIMDGFVLLHGRWQFVSDIEARNKATKGMGKPKTEIKNKNLYKKTAPNKSK